MHPFLSQFSLGQLPIKSKPSPQKGVPSRSRSLSLAAIAAISGITVLSIGGLASVGQAALINQLPFTQTKQVPFEALQPPAAIVNLESGSVTVQIVNQSGAAINYQVIGDTQFRSLGGNTEVALRRLPTPVNLTFRRVDGGLLQATVQANNPPGTLTLILNATTDFSADRTTLSIERSGNVYLN